MTTTIVNIRERVSHLVGNSLTSCLAALPRAYWGMVLAHCGIAIFIVGVTMVKGFEVEQDLRMNVGETANDRRLYLPVRWSPRNQGAELYGGTRNVSRESGGA